MGNKHLPDVPIACEKVTTNIWPTTVFIVITPVNNNNNINNNNNKQ